VTPFEQASAIADAVLYEGYLLYPYRSTSDKNRARFQWGVLCPRGAERSGAGEGPDLQLECLIDVGADAARSTAPTGAAVELHVRFLQLQDRVPERADGEGFTEVDTLEVDGTRHVRFSEAVERDVAIGPVALADLLAGGCEVSIGFPAGSDVEDLGAEARLVRHRWDLQATAAVSAEAVARGLVRLRVEVRNLAAWDEGGVAGLRPGAARDVALRRSLIATHLVLAVAGGAFVSLTDPPEEHRSAATDCTNLRTWPVLLGEEGSAGALLSAPIILGDHPEIAPESPGALFDATEIDEILLLRVLTMTDEEKREARATDPRAAAIVDLAEDLGPEEFSQLHGAIRELRAPHGDPDAGGAPDWPTIASTPSGEVVEAHLNPDAPWWDPGTDAAVDPTSDAVLVGGVPVARGSHVRLVPGRRADAHDLFLAGRAATVAAVLHDVDGDVHVAVTLDDDPGADLWDATGRYLYFAPEEIEPLEGAAP
jgi:hypothetical protein